MKFIDVVNEKLEQEKYALKKRTYLDYKRTVHNHIKGSIGEYQLEELNQSIINQYAIDKYEKGNMRSGEKLSHSTIKGIIGFVNRSLKYAYKRRYINERLEIDITIKNNSSKKVEALTKEEQRKLQDYILDKRRYYCYGMILDLYTGLRLGELLALKWSDIDLKNRIISIKRSVCRVVGENGKTEVIVDTPKTETSSREIPINSLVVGILKELKKYQKNNSEYVVSRSSGKRIENRSYQESFERLLKRLGIRHYGFHSLRHTFATRMLELGVDIKTLSELLGHANPTITLNTYVHSNMELKKEAMNKLARKVNLLIEMD